MNWNRYEPKTTIQVQNRYLDFLIDPSFQGINRLFVLLFKDDDGRESHKKYYVSTVEIKDYNVMIDWRNLSDQLIKNDSKAYDNIRKIAAGQGDDYATGKKYYKLICNRLEQTAKARCWYKSNTIN